MTRPAHILLELGFGIRRSGSELHGSAEVTPEMFVPATAALRTSILAAWVDNVCGLLAVDEIGPRVPVTLELDVELYEPVVGVGRVHVVGRTLKAGSAVIVASADLTSDDGTPLGVGAATFMPARDESLRVPGTVDELLEARLTGQGPRLAVPLAERAGCRRVSPGVAVFDRSEEGLNSSQTVNGGLLALGIEEAALSLTPGASLASLDVRYLQPVRFGPVEARADVRVGLGQVEVRDLGNDGRRCVVATTRTFP